MIWLASNEDAQHSIVSNESKMGLFGYCCMQIFPSIVIIPSTASVAVENSESPSVGQALLPASFSTSWYLDLLWTAEACADVQSCICLS